MISTLAMLAATSGWLALADPSPLDQENTAAIHNQRGSDLRRRDKFEARFGGYLRGRGQLLYNFDLDRGTSPSGQQLFPVSLANPKSQWLTHADTRLRTDLALYPPRATLALKLRVDVLDNLSVGSDPLAGNAQTATPALAISQTPPVQAFRIKQAYGEWAIPIGVLSFGRMPVHWGLGMFVNAGDCINCDNGNNADRIQFATSMLQHIWLVAFDVTSTGPLNQRRDGARAIDIEPTDNVRTITFAVSRERSPSSILRRRSARRATFDYGLYASHRWQKRDVPASYLSTSVSLAPNQVILRDYKATAVDAWARFVLRWLRVEAEAVVIVAGAEEASLQPGVSFREPIRSTQVGVAVESEVGLPDGRVHGGIDLGYASGDRAPGFGAFSGAGENLRPGDIDGPQARLPFDNRIDNFRFHPDYQIDRILFRELIGTVTDAMYVRPHVEADLLRVGRSRLAVEVGAVASRAVFAESTPGPKAGLGVEVDPSLIFRHEMGVYAALDYGVLFPFKGFDNPALDLSAKPAQLLQVRLAYLF